MLIKWAGYIARMGGEKNVYTILIGKAEGKRSFGRSKRKWEDNLQTNLTEIGLEGVDRIHQAKERDRWRAIVDTAMNIRVP